MVSVARPTQYASKIDYQNFAFLINKVLRAQNGVGRNRNRRERERKKFFLVSSTCGNVRDMGAKNRK